MRGGRRSGSGGNRELGSVGVGAGVELYEGCFGVRRGRQHRIALAGDLGVLCSWGGFQVL